MAYKSVKIVSAAALANPSARKERFEGDTQFVIDPPSARIAENALKFARWVLPSQSSN